MAVVAAKPPTSASTSPIQVRSGTTATSARQRGTTSHLTGSNPIDRRASISSDTFIVASLRRETGARSAGHDDRRDQRTKLTEMCDDDKLGNVGDGAETPELRDAEEPDDETDQQVGGARDQRARPRRSPGAASVASANRPSAVRRSPSATRWRSGP